jgi:hypothetical protein
MAPLLHGMRGRACREYGRPRERRVARLAADKAYFTELELNPLIARRDGVTAVDARAHIGHGDRHRHSQKHC